MKNDRALPVYEPAPCRDLTITDVTRLRRRDGMAQMVLCMRSELVDVVEPTDVLRAQVNLYIPLPRLVPSVLTVIQELGLQADIVSALHGVPLRACN